MYGYKMHPTEKNKIIIDEEAAPIVRRIFALALSGISCRQIASALNSENVPSPAAYAKLLVSKPGPYTGLWSSERVSAMLQNETYIGNMVQGRMVKISNKSKKCLRQAPEDWVVVEGTHEPLIDTESFKKVQLLLDSRRSTRSRTYGFLLKGLIFCHECGYPLAVLNRKNAAGEDVLYFVCRTYQRFTKAGVCTCHSIKEETVNETVLAKVREVCLSEEDFQRIYQKVKTNRTVLEDRLKSLQEQAKQPVNTEEEANALVKQFLDSALTSREVLVSLIERVELTEEKEIVIKFRFREPEAVF